MTIICDCNDGFEDSVSIGSSYEVKEIGANGYLIETDEGCEKWLGGHRFTVEV